MMKPSDLSAIAALRSCMVSTVSSMVRPWWAISFPASARVICAMHLAALAQGGVREHSHQPDLRAPVDEPDLTLGQ